MITTLTPDAFTQENPPVVTTQVSTTLLPTGGKRGVLGSSIAFTRPDYGNGYIGGPVLNGVLYIAGLKPLGIFINDSLGNPFENTPGVASNRGPHYHGSGTTVGTNTLDSGTPALREHGVFSASSAGTLWDRTLFASITLDGTAGDGLQSTYQLTCSAGG
jgi:hypothetical protein